MDRLATKDTHEREEDEAERLVRPAPKVKPPRRDRRRETVQTDRDPDTSGDPDLKSDRDMSLNYKSVGGSVTARVVDRFLTARGPTKVKVRKKDTGNVTFVTDQTLKEKGGEYEVVEKEPAKTPEVPTEAPATKSEAPTGPAAQPGDTVSQLRSLADSNPAAASVFKRLLSPDSELLAIAKDRPDFPLPKFKGIDLPPDIKTVGQLISALQTLEKTPLPKKAPKKAPQKAPEEEASKPEAPKDEAPKPESADEQARQTDEQIKRFQAIEDKYPDANRQWSYFFEDHPYFDADDRTVYDKKVKKRVPLWEMSHEMRLQMYDEFERHLQTEAMKKTFEDHADNPAVQKALRDLAFVGGAAKGEGEVEGDVAKRLRAIQKEGYPLEGLSIGKNVPELRGVQLPPGIKTVADLVDAASKLPAPEKRESEKAPAKSKSENDEEHDEPKDSPAQRVVDRFKEDTLGSDAFKSYADALPSTDKDDDGNPLFPTKGKPKRYMRFENLPLDAQQTIVEKYEQTQRDQQRGKFIKDLSENPKTVDALAQVGSLAGKGKSGPEGASPIADRIRQLQESGVSLDELPIRKHLPEFKDVKFPPDIQTVGDLAAAAKDVKRPELNRPKVKPAEADEIRSRVRTFFPFEAAQEIVKLHPQDQEAILNDYLAFKQQEPTRKREFVNELKKVYQTDPSKVPPPEKVEKDGKQVPFESLSPVEQLEAHQAQKNKIVALSLAGQDMLHEGLRAKGMPDALATRITETYGGDKPNPKQVYREVLQDGKVEDPPSPARVRKMLDGLTDDERSVAASYLQARDLQGLSRKYLESGDINERQSAKEILGKLRDVEREMKARQDLYGVEGGQDATAHFARKVLKHLDELAGRGQADPRKAEEVRKWVREREAQTYDKELADWEEQVAKHQKAQKGSDPYRSAPEEELPPKPEMPEGYMEVRGPKKSKGLWNTLKSLIPSGKGTPKTASVIVARYLSTCTDLRLVPSMNTRQAVYWGVEPYPAGHEGFAPYNKWEQLHARDFGPADEVVLLATAREWLKEPVLSSGSMDPMVPDTRFRAALDYALKTAEDGKYAVGLHPAIYNKLLARLEGRPADQTLTTLRAASGNDSLYASHPERTVHVFTQIRQCAAKLARYSPQGAFDLMELSFPSFSRLAEIDTTAGEMTMTPKFAAQDADRMLARLDRLAATVQDKYASWGMPFETAKEIVNALDKTADEIEVASFGAGSLARRQAEIMSKSAKVVQRDADEKYMDTFKNPMQPIQTDADEPYMKLYSDDQSSAVSEGESTSGRKLAPGH